MALTQAVAHRSRVYPKSEPKVRKSARADLRWLARPNRPGEHLRVTAPESPGAIIYWSTLSENALNTTYAAGGVNPQKCPKRSIPQSPCRERVALVGSFACQ